MTLSKQDKQYFLSLTPSDITKEFLLNSFADRSEKVNGKMTVVPPKYKTSDTFYLEENEYFNKERVLTNCGLFIVNKLLVERDLVDVLGYLNKPIDKKEQGRIEAILSDALFNDVITTEDFANYLNRLQWLAFTMTPAFTSSFTMNTIKPLKQVVDERDKLLAKNRDKIEAGDVVTAVKIEKELVDTARNALKGDKGLTLYDSGARGSFGNSYKNSSIMKGPVFNPGTGKWEVVEKSYVEGIEKKDIPVLGNSIITAAYPKAVGTQTSGYLTKQLSSAFQGAVIGAKGTDCGTKRYVPITITNWNKDGMLYCYIMENGKPVLLTKENISKYIGKTVKLRNPMTCTSDKICNICAGERFYKQGITNIGLTTSRISATLLNQNMKKVHDGNAKIIKLDKNKLFM